MRLSETIKQQCRSTDLAARYGGDEFAVILIDADAGIAKRISERVQSALQHAKENPVISVSIGISIYPQDGRTPQELLEAADQHLYKRKKAARSHGVTAG
jgi:diguanylate cyclase (GGDEF)-like protein